jgi:hypothetical protein
MEIVIEKFLQLIDTTSAEAQRVKSEMTAAGSSLGKQVAVDLTLSNLASLRNLVVTDKLPRPSKGQVSNRASLGLSREVGEWTEDDRLLEASYAVEEYYRKSV